MDAEEIQSLVQEEMANTEATLERRMAGIEFRSNIQIQKMNSELQSLIFKLKESKIDPAGGRKHGIKLDFPTFDGSEDPLVWLYRCEKFFSIQCTDEKDKVGLAAFHMLGEVQVWYHLLELQKPHLGWIEFKRCCSFRFGQPSHSSPWRDVFDLKQTGSVDEYLRQFEQCLARATHLISVDQYVNLFTAGLDESIRFDVEMQNPTDLIEATNLARAFERRLEVARDMLSK